jgi:hypothetical protein
MPLFFGLTSLRFVGWVFVRGFTSKGERGRRRERDFFPGSGRGESLRGQKAQESKGPGSN